MTKVRRRVCLEYGTGQDRRSLRSLLRAGMGQLDAANRLTKVRRKPSASSQTYDQSVLEIAYDALGRRIESVEHVDVATGAPLADPNVTVHVYVGLAPIAEYAVTTNGAGGYNANVAREFVWGARYPEPVAMIDHTDMGDQPAGTTEVLHYLHDVLGSVVALTNSNGAVVERYDYDPYGTTYILDPAGVPLQLLPVDPWAADGYFHDHDQDGDLDAADYTDLMACANDTPYDPLCIYTHDRNGDRRVDLVDVGAYLAHADSNGLIGPPAGMANFGRPLRLPFDADGDGRIDLFDWYALQTCYDRATTRCTYLFDTDASAAVDGPDLDAFRASAEPPYSGPPSKPWRRQLIASRYGNPWKWTGQRYDATTGQYHFWARTYSPRLGRWLQRDPLGYADGISVYQYSRSTPALLRDLLGLACNDDPYDISDFQTLDGRRKTKDEYGNSDLFSDEEKQAGERVLSDAERDLIEGFKETGHVLASSAWNGYEFLSNVNLAAALGRMAARAGISVLVKGGKKTFVRAGKEISEEEARELVKKEWDDALKNLTEKARDRVKGLRKQLEEHKKKLAEYIANPDAYDHKGFLKNATTQELREQIIQGRINKLLGQIDNFEKQILEIIEGGT